MLTKKDRQLLLAEFSQVFATKEDLKQFVTKDEMLVHLENHETRLQMLEVSVLPPSK